MVLVNIVIWGLLIAFIVWLAKDLRARPHRNYIASGASATEILDRRLATGELDADEYSSAAKQLIPPSRAWTSDLRRLVERPLRLLCEVQKGYSLPGRAPGDGLAGAPDVWP